MLRRFLALAPSDQRHLLAVYRALRAAGAAEETCVAGLLHHIGKADELGRVRTTDRILNVLLRRYRPGWLAELAVRSSVPRPLRGLRLAAHHAAMGATFAASCGYNERIVWLIRHHDARDRTHDPQLALLVAADDAADSSSTYYT